METINMGAIIATVFTFILFLIAMLVTTGIRRMVKKHKADKCLKKTWKNASTHWKWE